MTASLERCSNTEADPLAGSAKQEKVYVLFEHPHGWSRDILDGGTFGPELTALLKEHLAQAGAGLQLIRHTGRIGRYVRRPLVFVVFAELGTIDAVRVNKPEDLLDLDLSAPRRNGSVPVEHPLLLVCTHGKRDACCAIKGRPMAQQLTKKALRQFRSGMVWETSHTKGHRFAPSLILMPWGYSYGRLNKEAAKDLVDSALAGDYFWPGNRGRGIFAPPSQVAELAVAQRLLEAGERLRFGELDAKEATVTHVDGRRWQVSLEQQEFEGVISSCGDEPKVGKAWVASEVHELESHSVR